MKIKVLKSGLFTTIQDSGRLGYEQYGIPQNGFLDVASAELANQLVGNKKNTALIEITGIGPQLKFDSACTIAITGADLSPTLNHRFVKNNYPITVKPHDVLSFGKLKSGFRVYLAIAGKIEVPEVYKSKSTNTLAEFGGYKGRALDKGDILEVTLNTKVEKPDFSQPLTNSYLPNIIQIEQGPEYDWFTFQEIAKFMQQKFTVTNESNRMGYRLDGNWLEHKKLGSVISSGNIPGVIQITPSLQPIVLLNDAGTTGGYPRIAICTQKGIDRLAQLKPNDSLEFSF